MPRSSCSPRCVICCSRTGWPVLCALGPPATPTGSFLGSRGSACCQGFVRLRASLKVTPVQGVHLARRCLAIVSVRSARHDTAHTGGVLVPGPGGWKAESSGAWAGLGPARPPSWASNSCLLPVSLWWPLCVAVSSSPCFMRTPDIVGWGPPQGPHF